MLFRDQIKYVLNSGYKCYTTYSSLLIFLCFACSPDPLNPSITKNNASSLGQNNVKKNVSCQLDRQGDAKAEALLPRVIASRVYTI
jgi:hypothetical protein